MVYLETAGVLLSWLGLGFLVAAALGHLARNGRA